MFFTLEKVAAKNVRKIVQAVSGIIPSRQFNLAQAVNKVTR